MDKKKVVVIGAGFGGLGSAILMARAGYDVTVVEKNDKVGGRANLLEIDGYKWDMGPSWYLMPDAFDRYFTAIGRKVNDYLDLQKLEPSYRVFFKPLMLKTDVNREDDIINFLCMKHNSKISGSITLKNEIYKDIKDEYLELKLKKSYFESISLDNRSHINGIMNGFLVSKLDDSFFEYIDCCIVDDNDIKKFIELVASDSVYLLEDIVTNNSVDSLLMNSLLCESEEKITKMGGGFLIYTGLIHGGVIYSTEDLEKYELEIDFLLKNGFEKSLQYRGDNIDDHRILLYKKVHGYKLNYLDLYADVDQAAETFEQIEQGSGDKLRSYLKSAAYQYGIAMEKFVFKNFDSIWDFMTPQLAIEGLQLNIFTKLYNYVSRFVKNENLKKLLMYPSVFLGTSPYETPALFNIMSHVDFNQGVFYPQGGIHEIPKALYQIALEEGVKFEFNAEVNSIDIQHKNVKGVFLKSNKTIDGPKFLKENGNINLLVSPEDRPKEGLSNQNTKTVSCIIKHPFEEKYILCFHKKSHRVLFPGGGIEEGENPIDAAKRETIEETGYFDFDNVYILGDVNNEFWHPTKNINYFNNDTTVFLNLKSLNQKDVSDDETKKHDILWVSEEEVYGKLLNGSSCQLMFNRIIEDRLSNYYRDDDSYDDLDIPFINRFNKINSGSGYLSADIIISNADMRHTETQLLEPSQQTYPESYWAKQVISPSGFILYLGVDGQLPQLKHHTLVFSDDWRGGFDQIFKDPQRPQDPNYYICNPSKTDPSVAPAGKENLFVLVPIAPGLESTPESLEAYRDHIIADIAHNCGIPDLQDRIEVSQIFSIPQFEQYYNAYKGTALGLAHTFFQSAVRRPQNYSKKVKGLYYAGGYTTPGIGMPMCLISAMMVADRVEKNK